MNKQVVVLGSCSACHVFDTENLPGTGETVMGNGYHMVVGGKGSGQAIVSYKLGSDTYMLEHLGNDSCGRAMKDEYERIGMHIEYVYLDDDASTGMGGIFLDSKGQNSIIIVAGANNNVSRQDIDRMEETIKGAKILGAQFEVPVDTVCYAIRMASQAGVRTLLDPAPVAEFDPELYHDISIIKPNEYEAEMLTGIPVTDVESAVKAGQWFLNSGVKEAAIITLGEKGVVLVGRERTRYFEGIQVEPKDTGGAGDTFAGALLAALSQDKGMEEAIQYAQCAAAICVTRTGSYQLTEQSEVDELYQKVYGK